MEHEDDAIVIIVGDENGKKTSHLSSIKIQKTLDETDSTSRTLDRFQKAAIVNEVMLDVDDTEEIFNEEFLSERQRLRYKQLKRKRYRRSFVKELREQRPELAEDSDLLISTLAEVMRSSKPPPPPQDHYVINGVMFECIVCSALFARKSDISRHYQEIHGPKYLSCFSCGLNFRRSTNLYAHEKRCKGPDKEVVLRARAISVGNKGRHRPFLKQAKKFRHLEFETN